MLRRPQRCLLQVVNLGTSSSHKTFIVFSNFSTGSQIGTVHCAHGRIRNNVAKRARGGASVAGRLRQRGERVRSMALAVVLGASSCCGSIPLSLRCGGSERASAAARGGRRGPRGLALRVH